MKKDTDYALSGDELLVAVFSKFEKGKKFNTKMVGPFSMLFLKASENPDYAQLFENYPFDKDGVLPHSPKIEEGIWQLKQAGLLWEDGSYFYLTGGIDIRWSKFIRRKLTPKQVELVGKLAKDIQNILDSKTQS